MFSYFVAMPLCMIKKWIYHWTLTKTFTKYVKPVITVRMILERFAIQMRRYNVHPSSNKCTNSLISYEMAINFRIIFYQIKHYRQDNFELHKFTKQVKDQCQNKYNYNGILQCVHTSAFILA